MLTTSINEYIGWWYIIVGVKQDDVMYSIICHYLYTCNSCDNGHAVTCSCHTNHFKQTWDFNMIYNWCCSTEQHSATRSFTSMLYYIICKYTTVLTSTANCSCDSRTGFSGIEGFGVEVFEDSEINKFEIIDEWQQRYPICRFVVVSNAVKAWL